MNDTQHGVRKRPGLVTMNLETIVVIVRQAPTGYVFAAFLIDLMGVGLKELGVKP